jgi:FAD/FMN-containing dehydrogenase
MVVCYTGDLGETEGALAPIRALGEPVIEVLQEWPYVRQQSFLDEGEPKGAHYYMKTEYIAELSDALLAAVQDAFAQCPTPAGQVGLLHLGGAVNERDEDDGTVGNRDARFVLGVIGMWEAAEPNADSFRQWVHDKWARVRPFSTGRTYVNFQTADESEERVRATYGANFQRLVTVKEKYDPQNVFRRNRNIRRRV